MSGSTPSYVVTGGGRGIGRAVTERLARNGAVVVLELDPEAVAWTDSVPGVHAVVGSAAEPAVAREAAARAGEVGRLAGWVNNAAVFRDADLDAPGAGARPGPDQPRAGGGRVLGRRVAFRAAAVEGRS